MTPTQQPPPRAVVMYIVWFSLFTAPIIYLAMGLTVLAGTEPTWQTDSSYSVMRMALFGCAAGSLLMQAIFAGIGRGRIALARTAAAKIQIATVFLIIRATMIETVSVFGLVLFVIHGNRIDLIISCAVSMLFMPLAFPTRAMFNPES